MYTTMAEGIFSSVGVTIPGHFDYKGGYFEYNGVYFEYHGGTLSTIGDVHYSGGFQNWFWGYQEYNGECSVKWVAIMSRTVSYHDVRGGILWACRGCSVQSWAPQRYQTSHSVLKIQPSPPPINHSIWHPRLTFPTSPKISSHSA